MTAAPKTPDCVCNYTGHCRACLAAGLRCSGVRANGRPCRATCFDGRPCGAPVAASPRRAPAMPLPELVDEPGADCVRALELHDAPAPEVDLVAALRASVDGPGARALAHALARPSDAETPAGLRRMPLDECRARAAALTASRAARASSASRPARALTLDDLDAHERARYSRTQPRALDRRVVSRQTARGVA